MLKQSPEALSTSLQQSANSIVKVDNLSPWEQIFYGEFDGNRRKRVLVKIIGE